MNDPRQVPDGPFGKYGKAADKPWPDTEPNRPGGLEEAPAAFLHAPAVLAPRALRPQRKIGVRLNRVGRIDLIVPDIAALPRLLRDRHVKRTLDVVLASVLLALFALPMMLIATVLLVSGGQALFVQPRVGRDRSRFACLKFRTMRRDAQSRLAAVLAADPAARAEWRLHQKLTDDPRITHFGRFLRKTSLDELPQLINVLRGEMSLVGPRPIVAPELDGYEADRAYFESPAFNDYAGCLPGMSGLWQVFGRDQAAYADRIELDRIYARNWSVALDLKILWRTVGVVLSGRGR